MQKTRNVIIKNQQKNKIRWKKVSILKRGDNDFYEILISFAGGILWLISKKVTQQEMLPYMEKLEKEKKVEKIDRFETEEYSNRYCGLVLVYRVIWMLHILHVVLLVLF